MNGAFKEWGQKVRFEIPLTIFHVWSETTGIMMGRIILVCFQTGEMILPLRKGRGLPRRPLQLFSSPDPESPPPPKHCNPILSQPWRTWSMRPPAVRRRLLFTEFGTISQGLYVKWQWVTCAQESPIFKAVISYRLWLGCQKGDGAGSSEERR